MELYLKIHPLDALPEGEKEKRTIMPEKKKQLQYFSIEGAVGGNQEWFRNVVMYMGGCAAATACDSCIYFALQNKFGQLYPFETAHLTKEDYIRFGMKMKPYLKPRAGGVRKLAMYIDGFSKYLLDAGNGESLLTMREFSGTHTVEEAEQVICRQIDAGFPIPYLMLRHQNPAYKDFVWHWFLCYGYEKTEEDFQITVATYGESATFSLKDLWETGYAEKGGLILYDEKRKTGN